MKAAGVKEEDVARLQFHRYGSFQQLLILFQIRPQKQSIIQTLASELAQNACLATHEDSRSAASLHPKRSRY